MNDEQFEALMGCLIGEVADKLRARDTAQRESLARVEAERDRLAKRLCICHSCGGRGEVHTGQYTDEGQWQPPEPVMVECGECGGDGQIGQVIDLDTAQAQLAEAVGLLRYSQEIARLFDDEHTAEVGRFLARHPQAEQQEAREPVLARPEHGVGLDEALALTMDRYSGAIEKLAASEQQEANGTHDLDAVAEAIFNADKDNWYSAGPYPQLHANDKARLRVMARAALATQPAALPTDPASWPLKVGADEFVSQQAEWPDTDPSDFMHDALYEMIQVLTKPAVRGAEHDQ